MRYVIIAAMCRNRGIGSRGSLPWKIPQDFHHFSTTTRGNGNNAIVMGRTTWEGLRSRPLDGRANIILSTDPSYCIPDGPNDRARSFATLDAIHQHCVEKDYDTVWICGGEKVYRAYLDSGYVDDCVITYIEANYACDTYFPQLGSAWQVRRESLLCSACSTLPRCMIKYIQREQPSGQNKGCP